MLAAVMADARRDGKAELIPGACLGHGDHDLRVQLALTGDRGEGLLELRVLDLAVTGERGGHDIGDLGRVVETEDLVVVREFADLEFDFQEAPECFLMRAGELGPLSDAGSIMSIGGAEELGEG